MERSRLLILGYYDRSNLGDEAFKEVIPLFFQGFDLNFISIDDFNGDIYKYDGIICGGGDIINNYFYRKLSKILKGYNKNVFAFGVGIPYPSLIDAGYFDIFDHMFIRNQTDLLKLQRRYGSKFVHYLPDLVFRLDVPRNIVIKKTKNKPVVGLFLIQSLYKYRSIVYSITRFVELLLKEYDVIFYSFNTSGEISEDDTFINNEIYSSLSIDYDNVDIDNTRYSPYEMIDVIKSLDYCLCMRFHSHIMSTIAGTPFLSVFSTRKVEQYITEEEYLWAYKIELDENSKPLRLCHRAVFDKFNYMVDNSETIKHKLVYIRDKYRQFLNTLQPCRLMKIIDKRPNNYDPVTSIDIKHVYKNVKNMLMEKTGFDMSKGIPPEKPLNKNKAEIIGKQLCMMVTGMPSSRYVYGTIDNICTKPEKTMEMIKWIAEDFAKSYNSTRPVFNINYMGQSEFKGLHRAGWQYVIDYMNLVQTTNGVLLDVYLDRTFHWSKDILLECGILPYTSPWVGFIHHTPDEEYTEYNTTKMLEDPVFIHSIHLCKGIYAMTSYMVNWIKNKLIDLDYGDIPVNLLYHPTIIPKIKFSIEDFLNNPCKKIINIGAWYRNPFTIHTLILNDDYEKCSLKGKDMDNYFSPDSIILSKEGILSNTSKNKLVYYMNEYIKENDFLTDELGLPPPENFQFELFDNSDIDCVYSSKLRAYILSLLNTVTILEYLPNSEYDKIFSENVIFVNLINCSAANTIIESIVRGTPIIINRLAPAEEYLGKNYPLFYDDVEEIFSLVTTENITKAAKYLGEMDTSKLSIERFIDDIRDSTIYKRLL